MTLTLDQLGIAAAENSSRLTVCIAITGPDATIGEKISAEASAYDIEPRLWESLLEYASDVIDSVRNEPTNEDTLSYAISRILSLVFAMREATRLELAPPDDNDHDAALELSRTINHSLGIGHITDTEIEDALEKTGLTLTRKQ